MYKIESAQVCPCHLIDDILIDARGFSLDMQARSNQIYEIRFVEKDVE